MSKLKFKECEDCEEWNGNRLHCADICMKPFEAMDEFDEYKTLEEQGLLLRLPCKLGTKVYYVQKCLAPSCKECRGFLQVNNCYCDYKARIFEQYFEYRHLKAFGQSVFLTKEEAEAALKEMEK